MSKRRPQFHTLPQPRYPARVLVGVAAVVALALLGAVNFYDSLAGYAAANRDPNHVAAQEERFRAVIDAVPPDAVLGYLCDIPREKPEGQAAYFLAQYALAPRILVPAEQPRSGDLVLGNFIYPTDLAAIQQQHRLAMVRDFGGGVVLFRRQGR